MLLSFARKRVVSRQRCSSAVVSFPKETRSVFVRSLRPVLAGSSVEESSRFAVFVSRVIQRRTILRLCHPARQPASPPPELRLPSVKERNLGARVFGEPRMIDRRYHRPSSAALELSDAPSIRFSIPPSIPRFPTTEYWASDGSTRVGCVVERKDQRLCVR